MAWWREVADAVTRGVVAQRRYWRAHPAEAAREFRAREIFYAGQGMRVAARIAAARARYWEARAAEAGEDCA